MTLKKRGLGRGLEALLVDVPAKGNGRDAGSIPSGAQGAMKGAVADDCMDAGGRATQGAVAEQRPVIVKETNDQAAMAAALIKNIQRENSHLLEEAESLISLLDEFELMVRRFEID